MSYIRMFRIKFCEIIGVLLLENLLCNAQIEVIGGFTVVRESNFKPSVNITSRLPYETVISNAGQHYDPATSTFGANGAGGTWYISMSGGVDHATPRFDLTVERISPPSTYINMHHDNSLLNGNDIVSRGIFRYLSVDEELNVVASPDSSLESNPVSRLTSWTMFRFEELERTVVAFSVARSVPQDLYAEPLTFDTVVLNIQNEPFNTSTSTFTASVSGIYFCHLSAGTIVQRETRIHLKKTRLDNSTEVLVYLLSTEDRTDGHSVISRSLMTYLGLNERLHVVNNFGSALYSDGGWQTSFTCFGYSLLGNPNAISFFAGLARNWEDTVTLAPVKPWEDVTVNQGGAFDGLTGLFICPTAGTYFVSFSAGAQPGKKVGLTLYKQGQPVAMLERTSTDSNGIDTLSRDVVVDLATGDQLHLEALAGTALYSNAQTHLTSFLAFRLKNAGLG